MSVDSVSDRLTHCDHAPCFGKRRLTVEWKIFCVWRPWQEGGTPEYRMRDEESLTDALGHGNPIRRYFDDKMNRIQSG